MGIYRMSDGCVDRTMGHFHPEDRIPGNALQTGYTEFDRMVGGFRPGSLYIIGSRPGMGRSLLAYNIMIKMSVEQGIPAAIFSLETPADKVIRRMLCAMSMARYDKVLFEDPSEETKERFRRSADLLKAAPVTIDDTFYMDIREVAERIRQLKEERNTKIVFWDDLQLLLDQRMDPYGDNPTDGIFSRMKQAAEEAGAAVVLLSNLSRKLEERKDRHPKLFDFKLPTELMDLADGIFGVYRDEYYDMWTDRKHLMEVGTLKNRYGYWCGQTYFSCMWDGLVPCTLTLEGE